MQLTRQHVDVLKELVSVGTGRPLSGLRASGAHELSLEIDSLEVSGSADLPKLIGKLQTDSPVGLRIEFCGAWSGAGTIIVSARAIPELLELLSDKPDPGTNLDPLAYGVFVEVGTAVLGRLIESVDLFGPPVRFALPQLLEPTPEVIAALMETGEPGSSLVIGARMTSVKRDIGLTAVIVLESEAFDKLMAAVDDTVKEYNR